MSTTARVCYLGGNDGVDEVPPSRPRAAGHCRGTRIRAPELTLTASRSGQPSWPAGMPPPRADHRSLRRGPPSPRGGPHSMRRRPRSLRRGSHSIRHGPPSPRQGSRSLRPGARSPTPDICFSQNGLRVLHWGSGGDRTPPPSRSRHRARDAHKNPLGASSSTSIRPVKSLTWRTEHLGTRSKAFWQQP